MMVRIKSPSITTATSLAPDSLELYLASDCFLPSEYTADTTQRISKVSKVTYKYSWLTS